MLRSAFVVLLLLLTAAGQATPEVSIKPGESVTLALVGDQLTVVSRGEAAPLSPMELNTVREFGMNPVNTPGFIPPVGVPSTPGLPPLPIQPGEVRLTMRLVPVRSAVDEQTILTINNGFDSSFRFTAVMHSADRSTPTDVCEVHPRKHGMEQWPYRIDRLDLSNLRLEPGREDLIHCQ